jgi:hypothetical protein
VCELSLLISLSIALLAIHAISERKPSIPLSGKPSLMTTVMEWSSKAVEDRAGDNLEQEFGADFGQRQISVSSLSWNEMPATAACQSAVSIG